MIGFRTTIELSERARLRARKWLSLSLVYIYDEGISICTCSNACVARVNWSVSARSVILDEYAPAYVTFCLSHVFTLLCLCLHALASLACLRRTCKPGQRKHKRKHKREHKKRKCVLFLVRDPSYWMSTHLRMSRCAYRTCLNSCAYACVCVPCLLTSYV